MKADYACLSRRLIILLASLFTAGLGFLLHEMGHKIAAQHYGCEAEFRSDDSMLYLAVGMAFVIGFQILLRFLLFSVSLL